MVHRHELDHAASQHRPRHQSMTVAGLVVDSDVDDPPDVIAQPFADSWRVDVGAQQQRRREQCTGGADHAVGGDRRAIGEHDPTCRSSDEVDAVDRGVGHHVDVAAVASSAEVVVRRAAARPVATSERGDRCVVRRRQQRPVDDTELVTARRLAGDEHFAVARCRPRSLTALPR